MTNPDRALIARIAAHERWARTADRSAATAACRKVFLDRFEAEVDPDGKLDPTVRARLAENKRRAYFQRLALRSAQARRKATDAGQDAAKVEAEIVDLTIAFKTADEQVRGEVA
jgi:hypothetical protein